MKKLDLKGRGQKEFYTEPEEDAVLMSMKISG